MGIMKQIRVPRNTFVACSLAETMEVFDLHKDALRIDHYIAQTHFVRPIFAMELETLWNCLGESSRYVYAAIKAVGRRLQEYDKGINEDFPKVSEMLAMLDEYPTMKARVRDLDLNEGFQPVYGTEWTKKPSKDTQKNHKNKSRAMRSSIPSSKHFRDCCPAKEPSKKPLPIDAENATSKVAVLRIVAEKTNLAVANAGTNTEPEKDAKEKAW
jgi:hypothetical protein